MKIPEVEQLINGARQEALQIIETEKGRQTHPLKLKVPSLTLPEDNPYCNRAVENLCVLNDWMEQPWIKEYYNRFRIHLVIYRPWIYLGRGDVPRRLALSSEGVVWKRPIGDESSFWNRFSTDDMIREVQRGWWEKKIVYFLANVDRSKIAVKLLESIR